MINNVFFQISGIIFVLFLLKIYLSKKWLVSVGNNIYNKLIIANLVSLLLDILNVTMIVNYGTDSIVSIIFTKLYMASILVWLTVLTSYIYIISFKKVERLSKIETSSIKKVFMIIIPASIFCLVLLSILPIDLYFHKNSIYFGGISSYFLYAVIFVAILSWLFRYIRRANYIKSSKKNSIFFMIMFSLLGIVIQVIYPEFLFLSFLMYFITFTTYFNIDNPDLELINELETAKKQVEEAEVTKKDALLKASHEIRTPLNAIIGFSGSILEGSSEDTKEDVKYIKTASENLLDVVNNILDVSSVDAQLYKLVYGKYSIDLLMKQIVAIAKSKMENEKVDFNVKIDDNMPAFLYGDSIKLKDIILNIIYNAIKYTKEGYISLNAGCINSGNVSRLIVSIKDTGIGMPVDRLETVFKGKVKENNELMEANVDLNLATMKEIVESMNGELTIESEYNEGTTVKLLIDQKIVNEEEVENKDVETDSKIVDFSGKQVLIVDDDKINLKVAARLLKNYNVKIDEASSGFECVDKIKNGNKYDLIFLDDWMPNMSGVETLKQLDEIEGFNSPVIALTANATSGMKEKYIREGFNDYISKPVERKELDRVVKKYLSN